MIDAFVEGDLETARRKHLRLLPIARALFPAGWSNPIAVKAALNLNGFPGGRSKNAVGRIADRDAG